MKLSEITTNREMRGFVLRHLVAQGERSGERSGKVSDNIRGFNCMYRGPGGLKCAIGCLLSDEAYYKGLEGCGTQDADVEEAVINSLTSITEPINFDLLFQLQNLHDNYHVEDWTTTLDKFNQETGDE